MTTGRLRAIVALLLCSIVTSTAQIDPTALDHLGQLLPEADFLTFPQARENPIRFLDELPVDWTSRTAGDLQRLSDTIRPGEYFTFQIGVLAHKGALENLSTQWTSFSGATTLPRSAMTCFNTEGIDFRGNPFRKSPNLRAGRIQPLWFGVQIPETARGTYRSVVTVSARRVRPQVVQVELKVEGDRVENHGFDRGKSLSRLAWLNTTIGSGSDVTRPFEPVRRTGRTVQILGRTVELSRDGLPSAITSYFEPSNQFLVKEGKQLLGAPFHFIIQKEDGSRIRLTPGEMRFTDETPSGVRWSVTSKSNECELLCDGLMEFDGYMEYGLTLKARKPVAVRDIRLEVPLAKGSAPYMMGLNHEGGLRPARWEWQWDTTRNQDLLWIGDVNGGLRFKWKAENYRRPLINIYYRYGPLHLPSSWGNMGKGGVTVSDSGNFTFVNAYSGPRQLRAGDPLHFDLELLITPARTIDAKVRWGDRYFHGGGTNALSKVARADSLGANIINIHHAEDIYPFINYPYLDENIPRLRRLVDSAHQMDKRLKVYYTTRELTKNLPEFWAFRSLNGEVIFPGPGDACTTVINPKGPDKWLKENVKEDYIPAWLNPINEGPFKGELDLSVITTPDSRLNNFYVGGLDWMLDHLAIDGVYVDDSALDRLTVRRARRLIDRYRPQGRIDLHSWNHFQDLAKYANSLNLYLDLLPYIDLVWIGEARDYNRMPDHWLIEVCGIPYGVPGQMLEGGGNPWRGMVFGITNRPPWSGHNPSDIWQFWDRHNFEKKTMIGYWDRACPVKTGNDLVKATVYRGKDESVIAVAGWGPDEITCALQVDWKALGLDPERSMVSMPAIPGFQEERKEVSLEKLVIPAGKGFLITCNSIAG